MRAKKVAKSKVLPGVRITKETVQSVLLCNELPYEAFERYMIGANGVPGQRDYSTDDYLVYVKSFCENYKAGRTNPVIFAMIQEILRR